MVTIGAPTFLQEYSSPQVILKFHHLSGLDYSACHGSSRVPQIKPCLFILSGKKAEKPKVEEAPALEEPAAVFDGENDSEENSSSSSEEGILENETSKDSK